jgi:hypothetical protein
MDLPAQPWDDSTRLAHRPGCALEEMDGELLVYVEDREQVIHFNQTAALVWRLCDGSRTVADVVALLVDAYPDAPAVRDDVRDTIARLVRCGALVPCPS